MSTTPEFDPDASWLPFDAKIATETDPRRRANLERVRDHMRTEIGGDLEGLMATLVDAPRYHFWGAPVESGPKGRDAVEAFYRQMIDNEGHRFHFDVRRIAVDHDTVVTEGSIHQPVDVAALRASGIEEVDGRKLEDGETILAETQIVTVWPIAEDGQIIGEDIYFGSPPLSRLRRA